MKLELYSYCLSSASWRVRIVLAHKAVPFALHAMDLKRGDQLQDTYAPVHPLHQVPVLRVTEAGKVPVTLTQSVAICEYLEERWPEAPLLPASAAERAQVRALVETVNAGIQPLQNLYVRKRLAEQHGVDDVAWTQHFIARGLTALEALAPAGLGPFLCGPQPTLADVFLVPQLYNARRLDMDVSAYSRLLRADAACSDLAAWHAARPEQQTDWAPLP